MYTVRLLIFAFFPSRTLLFQIVQLGPDYCTPFDFWIYVLVCTAQTTKGMKTNDIPLKSPLKLQQEMQKKF